MSITCFSVMIRYQIISLKSNCCRVHCPLLLAFAVFTYALFIIDRWQSLNVRTLDIRDRLEDTGTEWRQLLMDLQEIIDWIARADQELTLQQPIGGDLESVQNQNEMHQVTIYCNRHKVYIELKGVQKPFTVVACNRL